MTGRDSTGLLDDSVAADSILSERHLQSEETGASSIREVHLEGIPVNDPALQGAVGAEGAWNATARLSLYVPSLQAIERSLPSAEALRGMSDAEVLRGAEEASKARNEALRGTRAVLSSGGRAVSVAVKPVEPSTDVLREKYPLKSLQGSSELQAKLGVKGLAVESAEFRAAARTLQASREVSLRVWEAASRSNAIFTVGAGLASVTGSVMLAFGLGHSVSEVYYAPEGEKTYTAGREMSAWAGARYGASVAGRIALTTAPKAVEIIPNSKLRAGAAIVVGAGITFGGAWLGASAAQTTYEFAFGADN